MEKGEDLGGNKIEGSLSFCVGAIVTPEANPIEPQLIKFEKKIEAGAEFIQTQAAYDLDRFKTFMDYARQFPVKILAGIILLTSAAMARFMNKNLAGVNVPQDLIDEMAGAPKGRALDKGIEIAGRMIRRLREERMCHGVHIMAIGREELAPTSWPPQASADLGRPSVNRASFLLPHPLAPGRPQGSPFPHLQRLRFPGGTEPMDKRVCPPFIAYFLLNPFRKLLENPERIFRHLVHEGMTIIEPGCAMGFFTLPLARMVGPKGRVIALDIQEKMLSVLRKRAARAGLSERIELRRVGPHGYGLEDLWGEADLVPAIHVVHEIADKKTFFREMGKALRPRGRLLVMEPRGHVSREAFEKTCALAEEAGFVKEELTGKIGGRSASFLKGGDP